VGATGVVRFWWSLKKAAVDDSLRKKHELSPPVSIQGFADPGHVELVELHLQK